MVEHASEPAGETRVMRFRIDGPEIAARMAEPVASFRGEELRDAVGQPVGVKLGGILGVRRHREGDRTTFVHSRKELLDNLLQRMEVLQGVGEARLRSAGAAFRDGDSMEIAIELRLEPCAELGAASVRGHLDQCLNEALDPEMAPAWQSAAPTP